MKISLEEEDRKAIVEELIAKLKPLLSGNGNNKQDIIFDKKTLAAYLKVSESTINKLVSNKEIPHFKIQAGQSGAVRFRQRDIDKWIQRQSIPDILK